jgi:hypothetical protein
MHRILLVVLVMLVAGCGPSAQERYATAQEIANNERETLKRLEAQRDEFDRLLTEYVRLQGEKSQPTPLEEFQKTLAEYKEGKAEAERQIAAQTERVRESETAAEALRP